MSLFQRIPRAIRRNLKIFIRSQQARRLGLAFQKPVFLYFPRFNADSVIIDAGCGYLADLSQFMIKQYGLRSFGVDPTRKHAAALAAIAQQHPGRFIHLPNAVCSADATLSFYESENRESGSILADHTNTLRQDVQSYAVEGLCLSSLLKRMGVTHVDLLKLDIEGAEFDLLEQVQAADLAPFEQIFIEFHHHAIRHLTQADTERSAARICSLGFKCFSLDDHNYLFYRS
jgi:FkbM family methyltransferase